MILGFTGTRQGTTEAQRAAWARVIAAFPDRVMHGGAVGADTEFDTWLMMKGLSIHNIEIYPGTLDREDFWLGKRAWLGLRERRPNVHPIMLPLDRNKLIATRCDALIACPAGDVEEVRSGTWATIRYARGANKPIVLVYPDGSVREERGR